MTWFGWTLFAVSVFTCLINVGTCLKPRRAIGVGGAVFSVCFYGLLVWALFTVGTGKL